MKKITTNNGVYGPYHAVETLEDRYRCDRADLPFSVVGEGTVADWAGPLPAPAVAPVPVPQSVTMRQARLALLGAGLLDDVEAAINSLPSPQKEAARIEWEYSQEVQRHNGFVSILAPSLGMTDAQTDALFIAAAGL